MSDSGSDDSYYEDLVASMEGMAIQRGIIEMKVELKVSTKIKHAYQEQNLEQSVVFKCRDGKVQRCSRWALELSDYFSEKIKGFDNCDNEHKFDYTQYNHETIKLYLDLIHGINVSNVPIDRLVELLGFLSFEGKTATSDLEKRLYNLVLNKIHDLDASLATKVLVWIIFKEIDDDFYNKDFYEYSTRSIRNACVKVDLYSEVNKPLVELILGIPIDGTNKDQAEIEMGTKMFLFERQLTKLIDEHDLGRDIQRPFKGPDLDFEFNGVPNGFGGRWYDEFGELINHEDF